MSFIDITDMYRHTCLACCRSWLSDCRRDDYCLITRWCPKCLSKAGKYV